MTITATAQRRAALISETTAAEMQIDSYVMQRTTQACLNCQSQECYSTIFEVWVHPTKTATTGVRSLKPAIGALKNLPLAIVDLRPRTVPTCYDCVETFEPHGNRPIAPVDRMAWEETLKRKYAPAPKGQTEKHTPALEDL